VKNRNLNLIRHLKQLQLVSMTLTYSLYWGVGADEDICPI